MPPDNSNPVRPPRAILFDWDNTLVDNWEVILAAFNTALAAMDQRPWTLSESRARIKHSLRDGFPAMFGDRWREARKIFYDHFTATHLDGLRPMPGAVELLGALAKKDIYLGVVSNKRGDLLRREAEHLGWTGYFGKLIGADDAPEDKPAVAPVDMALVGSGVTRGADVWLVGDNDVDVLCARNAACVAVLVGDTGPELSGSDKPDLFVADCSELAKLLHQS